MECRLLKSGISACDLSKAIFNALLKADLSIKAEFQDGVGCIEGDSLRINWVSAESGKMLAVEVLEKQRVHIWEMSIIPINSGRAVFSRRSIWNLTPKENQLCAPCNYTAIFESFLSDSLENDSLPNLQEPHFLALVAAVTSHGGLSVIKDDSATIANIQSEVEYWRDLAKSQHKLLQDKSSRMHQVHNRHVTKQSSETNAEHERQWVLRDIEEWAAINSDRIIILPRAVAATKRSDYENAAFLFECLELLANEYTSVKLGIEDRSAFKDKADTMGLKYGGSVDPSVAGEQGEAYFVRWRGSRRFLDQHVTKGSSRETRFSLRIYFTWDEIDEKVVIGWMPSHLGTSHS
jgi:hypothetical protein